MEYTDALVENMAILTRVKFEKELAKMKKSRDIDVQSFLKVLEQVNKTKYFNLSNLKDTNDSWEESIKEYFS